jgi:hypothetical protein
MNNAELRRWGKPPLDNQGAADLEIGSLASALEGKLNYGL